MTVEILSEGSRFAFDGAGAIEAGARIPAERPVLRVSFPNAPPAAWTIAARGVTTILRCDGLEAQCRPDSVLVLRAARPVAVRVESLFRPEYAEGKHGRRLLLDEHGGFGVYPTRPGGSDATPPFDYGLAAGDELWISVCPPRHRNALRESEHVAHEGRPRPFPDAAYPSTRIIEDAARHCRVLAFHAYFWASGPRRVDLRAGRYALRRRPWTTARHVPADPERFERVKDDARRCGMRLVVYLSPRHSTAPDLYDEMRRVLDEYGVDGLYLDGLSDDFRANDRIVRRTREILGPDRILYLNASAEPFGTPRVHCPFIDSHADYVLRGDSGRGGLPLNRFLRYAVSGRNVSNSVGMWCHYGSSGRLVPADRAPSASHIDAALRHGVRLWRRSVWGAGLAEFDRRYYSAFER
jgi:hypothetical protein